MIVSIPFISGQVVIKEYHSMNPLDFVSIPFISGQVVITHRIESEFDILSFQSPLYRVKS